MRVKCFVINLRKRTDRRKNFIENVERCCPNLDYSVIDAIEPNGIDPYLKLIFGGKVPETLKWTNIQDSPAAHGHATIRHYCCRLSHFYILHLIKQKKLTKEYDRFIICEDDVEFLVDVNKKLDSMKEDFDMLFLSAAVKRSTEIHAGLHKYLKGLSTVCYCVGKNFIDHLYQKRIEHWSKPADQKYGYEHMNSREFMLRNKIYVPHPLWAIPSSKEGINFSDCSRRRTKGWRLEEYKKSINWKD